MQVRTRIAPSPTGEFHLGGLRTALYNYAFAKKKQGQFIIRIEDTDQTRLVKGATDRLLKVLNEYGLSWNEGPETKNKFGPYIQSQRLKIYQTHIQKLVEKSHAYRCFCTKEELDQRRHHQKAQNQIPKYDRRCLKLTKKQITKKLKSNKPHVIRQKLPDNQEIKFKDLVMGEITINTKELDDTVLMKSDGFPTYHLAVVIDDHLMQISHVIRGAEWITSTPKHILLYQAFGWEQPQFAHLPVILNPDGKGKLSKRKGGVSARSFLDKGYLPEAMLNYLMLLGWSPKNDREFFTLDEFIQKFELKDLNQANPAFDEQKLLHFNMHYIQKLSDQELAQRLIPFSPPNTPLKILKSLSPLVKERVKTLAEFTELTGFIFNTEPIGIPESGWKDQNLEHLKSALQIIKEAKGKDWNTEYLTEKFMSAIKTNNWKTGHFFMNLRLAISGQPITPPITECLVILDKDKTLARLQHAINSLTS